MNTSQKCALSLAVAIVTGVPAVQSAPLSVSSEKTVLLISETVTPAGTVNISAKAGPLTTSESGFGLGTLSNKVAPGRISVSLPAISVTGYFGTRTGLPTSGTVLSQANAKIRANYPALQGGLAAYMRANGISSGWFTFKQEIQVDANGVAENWTILWDYFTDHAGRGAYADARLVPPDPKFLYLVYTPLRVDQDLPQSWSYADAGTLKYQLRDMKFQPVTDWATLNTGGAYDSAQTETENLDAGVRCLMDSSNSGCVVGPTDVSKLLDSTGAVMAVVDYGRRVEPQWIEQPDGSLTPKMSIAIDKREVSYTGCNETTYRNIGSFGYTLQTNVGRYVALAAGSPRVISYQQIQEFTGTYSSPTQGFDYSLPVRRADVPALSSYGIDPVKGGALLALSDIPGLTSVAQVTALNSPSTIVGHATGGLWWYGNREDRYKVRWTLKCAAGRDGYEITTRLDHQRYSYPWDFNEERTYGVSDSGWSAVGLAGFNESRYIAYADYANRMVWLDEGTKSNWYAYTWTIDEGNDPPFVCGHNNFSMQQTWNENYGCENKNIFTYDCGTAARPANWYLDGVFQGRITQKQCRGSTYLRGFYMDSGQPHYVNIPVSETDRTTGAYWWCDTNGACDWRLDENTGGGGGGGGGGGNDGPVHDQPEQVER